MKVLYIDGVGPFGGASRSLYEAVRAVKNEGVEVYFVTAQGSVVPYYSELANDIVTALGLTRFDNTQYSYYRGLRWIVVLRELVHLPSTLLALARAKLRWKDIDLIHVNEITEVLPMLLARWLFKVPVVVHVRSVARRDTDSSRCRWINGVLRNKVNAVVAIDESVRASLPADLSVDVIHNSFTPKYAANPDQEFFSQLSRLDGSSLKVGFVGNLLLAKGLFDLLDAAKIVCDQGHNVEFLIVGDVARKDKGVKAWILNKLGLAQDIKSELLNKIRQYGLSDKFHLLGATHDIQRAYEHFDVLCFPSHFDAPGRPIFEAAFSGVPSIAAINQPKPDTLIDRRTGLAVPPKNPEKLAEAILYFVSNPEETKRMGENAKALAKENFTPSTNAEKLLMIYRRVLNSKTSS
jgi:glycosyltransferase involved in cell wall biosynthesis